MQYKLKPLHTDFLHSTKYYGFIIGTKLDKDPLAAEQNSYLSKILNVQIAYDLDASPRNPTNNFKLKSCLFGATNIVKNNYKEKVFEGIRNNI